MDTRKIKKLIELVKATEVSELEVKSGEESVRISIKPPIQTSSLNSPPIRQLPIESAPATSFAETVPSPTSKKEILGHKITAPMVGTVYLGSKPGAPPFVKVGQHVSPGDTLCLIEAMKMFNKIESDTAGVVSACLTDNEQPVEYDQVLFIIDADASAK